MHLSVADIALAVSQRLPPGIAIWNRGKIGFGDLDIVAEYFVIADFQVFNARRVLLPLFHGGKPFRAAGLGLSQLIHLCVVAGPDKAAVPDAVRRILTDAAIQIGIELIQRIQLIGALQKRLTFAAFQKLLNARQRRDRVFQRNDIARIQRAVGNAGKQALDIVDFIQLLPKIAAKRIALLNLPYGVQPRVDLFLI